MGDKKIVRATFIIPDLYHLFTCFIIYSILGWFVESLYMSICNKKITNRGFMFLPFCPIYGFGAIIGCILLSPLINNLILLYLVSAISATIFEFLVAKLMLALFDEFWWDYSKKTFNYKGILCLESTLAWGFYGIFIVKFFNTKLIQTINLIDVTFGMKVCKIIFVIVSIDFIYHFFISIGINMEKRMNDIKEKYHNFKFRW